MSTIRMSGMISGLDTDSLVKELVSAQKLKNKKVSDKLTLSEWKEDKWKELNTKLYSLYTTSVSKMRLQGSYLTKSVTASDSTIASVTGGSDAPVGAHKLSVTSLAGSQYVTGGQLASDTKKTTTLDSLGIPSGTNITIKNGSNAAINYEVQSTDTIQTFLDKCNGAGLNASFDETNRRFFISSKESGTGNAFSITSGTNPSELTDLGLGEITGTADVSATDATTMSVRKASNAVITLDGAQITSNSNTITANGLTLNLLETTESGKEVTLNVSNNTDANYKLVKDFISSYNSILKEMNTLYYADSAKDYAPLSDDEKEAMTDTQVEQWESKIKDSILRRDDSLGTVINSIKSGMMSTYTDSSTGKTYSLANFGIQTSSDYTEKGLLHIYGDSDDSTYSAQTDKLKTAFANDPDTTIKALTGIFQNLYNNLATNMKSIPNVRSANTVYNDKLLDNEQTDYKKQIATLDSKLTDMENKYYKQFSAMETAMAKMQSQSNSLASLLGTN